MLFKIHIFYYLLKTFFFSFYSDVLCLYLGTNDRKIQHSKRKKEFFIFYNLIVNFSSVLFFMLLSSQVKKSEWLSGKPNQPDKETKKN